MNKAYKTLFSPIKRAEYILKLRGITIPGNNEVMDKELTEIRQRTEEVRKLINLDNKRNKYKSP